MCWLLISKWSLINLLSYEIYWSLSFISFLSLSTSSFFLPTKEDVIYLSPLLTFRIPDSVDDEIPDTLTAEICVPDTEFCDYELLFKSLESIFCWLAKVDFVVSNSVFKTYVLLSLMPWGFILKNVSYLFLTWVCKWRTYFLWNYTILLNRDKDYFGDTAFLFTKSWLIDFYFYWI